MMTGKKQIGDDEEKWELFKKLLEMWDSDKLIELMRSEYQRGRKDEREENLGRILGHLEGLLPRMATKDDLDRWAAQTITHGQDHKPLKISSAGEPKPAERSASDQKPLNVTACEEAPRVRSASEIGKDSLETEKRTSDALMAEKRHPETRLGGRPRGNDDRPARVPSNLDMAILALTELKEPSSAPEILMFIRNRWWPGCPESWKSTLIEFAKRGKLRKDGLNYMLPLTPQEKIDAAPKRIVRAAALAPEPKDPVPLLQNYFPNPESVREFDRRISAPRTPEPSKKLGPPARRDGELLEYGGQSVMLRPREYAMAKKLLAAKGQHIDANFLASSIGLPRTNAVNHETALRDLQVTMNPKVRQVGLEVEFWRGFGFLIKEVSSCG